MGIGELWRRIRSLVSARSREPDLDQEVQFHLDMQAEQHRRHGLSSADAGRAARRDFGPVARVKEEAREARGFPSLSEWLRDLRVSMRSLTRTPGFSAVAILTLGLGVGATTAIFSVVEAVLLRALPFPEPDQLVVPQTTRRTGGDPWTISAADFVSWQQAGIFDKVALFEPREFDVAGSGTPVRTQTMDVTSGFFQVLGTTPARGRFFVADDFTGSGAIPVVLSYGLWQRMGARNDVVGSLIKVRGVSSVIVGVAREGEQWPDYADLWTARRTPFDQSDLTSNNFIYQAVARLKPGSGLAPTIERLDLLARDQERAEPVKRKDVTITVTPAHDFVVGASLTRSLWVMLGAVAFVLLIACVNVANLLLARTTRRQSELSLRASLGASRTRLTRHLLSESLLLAIPGGLLGILLAGLGVAALKQIAPPNLPGLAQSSVNAPVLLAALLATGLTVLVAGLTPALHGAGLVQGAGRTTANAATGRLRAILVVALGSVSAIVLSENGTVEMLRQNLVSAVGVEAAYRLTGLTPPPVSEQSGTMPGALYRTVRLDRVPEGLVETIENDGYAFSLSCAVRLLRAGLKVAELPILRPLIGMDKLEITGEAQRLGTFEISIEPDADCCTLFVPRHPATRVSAGEIAAAEGRLDLPRLVAMGVDGARLERFEFPAVGPANPEILFA